MPWKLHAVRQRRHSDRQRRCAGNSRSEIARGVALAADVGATQLGGFLARPKLLLAVDCDAVKSAISDVPQDAMTW